MLSRTALSVSSFRSSTSKPTSRVKYPPGTGELKTFDELVVAVAADMKIDIRPDQIGFLDVRVAGGGNGIDQVLEVDSDVLADKIREVAEKVFKSSD